jgi:hypothetical protein
LSYYDVNDPSIALFNNIIKVENIANQKESEFNNLKKNESQTYMNEKTQKISININIDQKINNINEIMDNKKTESNIETSTDRKKMNLKSKSNNVKSEEKNIKVNRKISNNSITSPTLKNLGIKEDSLYNDYLSPNCFPLKTSSDVGNTSYNKINKIIREKKILNKLKLDYSMTQSKTTRRSLSKYNFSEKLTNNKKTNNKNEDLNLILASKKIKPKKNVSLYKIAINDEKKNNCVTKDYNHWDKGGNLIKNKKPKVNYFYFNNYIETVFNKDLINFKKNEENQFFYPMNAYNKLAGKYYYHNIEKKKKNKKKNKDKDKKANDDINKSFHSSKNEKSNNELIDNEKNTEEKKDNYYFYDQLNNSSKVLLFT